MSQHGASRHGLRASQCQRSLRIAAVLSVGSLLLGALTAQSSHAVVAQSASSATVLTVDEPVLDPIDAAAEEAAASGDDVVVEEYTTETQLVSVSPEGELSATMSPAPVRVLDGPVDSWVDVDTTLVSDGNGGLAPRHAVSDVVLSNGGAAPMAVLSEQDASLGLDWPGELPTPMVEGDTATYAEVLPGVDLVARATVTGFSTYIVVKTKEAASNPELDALALPVDLDGASMVDNGDGTLAAKDSSGQSLFVSGEAQMWDSKGIPEADESDSTELVDQPALARAADVELNLTADGDVEVVPDAALMNSTTVDFPLVIDPEWHPVTKNDAAWGLVWSNGSDWYNSDVQVPRVGYDGWSGQAKKSRSFYRFAMPDVLVNHPYAEVKSAQFTHKMTHSPQHTCNLASYGPTLEVYRTESFSSNISWPGPTLKGLQDTKGRASGHEDYCGADFVEWDVTEGVTNAHNTGETVVMFGMKSANESNRDGWRKFANGDMPELTVKFDRPPNFGQQPWISVGAVSLTPTTGESLTPQLTNEPRPAIQSIVDDVDGDAVKLCTVMETYTSGVGYIEQGRVCNSNIATAAGPATVNLSAWSPTLTVDRTYYLHGEVSDYFTRADGSPVMTEGPRRRVILDTTPPPKPTLVSWVPPAQWVSGGEPGKATFSTPTTPVETTGKTVRYSMNASVEPSCAANSPDSVKTIGANGQVTIDVVPSWGGTNELKVVVCDLATNRSQVWSSNESPSTEINASEPALRHQWLWKSATVPAPGTDTGSVAASWLTMADAPATDRDSDLSGPRPGETNDQWVRLGPTQQRAETPSPGITTQQGFTISTWVKVNSGIAGTQVIAAQAGTTVDAARLAATATGFYFSVRNGDSATSTAATASLTYAAAGCAIGQWCYVSGVWDNGTMKPRLVVAKDSGTSTAAVGSTLGPVAPGALGSMAGRFRVGAGQTAGTVTTPTLSLFLTGGVDMVRIWDGIRSDEKLRLDAA